jgi:hypothetical protein
MRNLEARFNDVGIVQDQNARALADPVGAASSREYRGRADFAIVAYGYDG